MENIIKTSVAIIGGGPAGMAAAIAAREGGVRDILILERDDSLGGILRQCIHGGFGLHTFGEELTGPEYAARYEARVREMGIDFMLNTMVIELHKDKTITAMSSERGIFTVKADAIVLAMGCRERPKGALGISGTRPAGIYTAGLAQKFVNMKGYMPGREVVILGSGDIGLIMARRMTLEGAKVHAVCELMPYSGGLARNIEQCLNDYNIPLKLSHTVTAIHGKERLEGVTVSAVDENRRPIEGSEEYIKCDTLLLSCGLIPENELTVSCGIDMDRVTGGAIVDGDRQTSEEGIFACGNVLHVHDLVDYVSEEAVIAGRAAAEYALRGGVAEGDLIKVKIVTDGKIRYTVPHILRKAEDTTVYFRVSDVFRDKKIVARLGDRVILSKRKLKLAPGEMETVKLSAKDIAEAKVGEIRLSLEEV